jgi:hypothetical protein
MPSGNVISRFDGFNRCTFHVRRGGSRGTGGLMPDVAGIDAAGREQKRSFDPLQTWTLPNDQ